jgi:RNA polymerase sigma-70 factor (ECF subfamily)
MKNEYRESTTTGTTSNGQPDEEELVQLARTGDGLAYTELCRRHARRVFLIVFRITKSREDAEDVVQEALMKALVHLEGFDGRSAFSTWLTRIAINCALMLRRKRRNHFEFSIDHDEHSGPNAAIEIADRTPSAEEHLRAKQMDRRIHRAIERLPSSLRVPLELQIAEDLPIRELAIRLGVSVPAIKSRLLRARMKVRCFMVEKRY